MRASFLHGNKGHADTFQLRRIFDVDLESVVVGDSLALRLLEKDAMLRRAERDDVALELIPWDLSLSGECRKGNFRTMVQVIEEY